MLSRPPLSVKPTIINCCRSSCSCMNKTGRFEYQMLFEAFAIQREVQALHSGLLHLIFNLLYSVTGNFPFSCPSRPLLSTHYSHNQSHHPQANAGIHQQNEKVFFIENKKAEFLLFGFSFYPPWDNYKQTLIS